MDASQYEQQNVSLSGLPVLKDCYIKYKYNYRGYIDKLTIPLFNIYSRFCKHRNSNIHMLYSLHQSQLVTTNQLSNQHNQLNTEVKMFFSFHIFSIQNFNTSDILGRIYFYISQQILHKLCLNNMCHQL